MRDCLQASLNGSSASASSMAASISSLTVDAREAEKLQVSVTDDEVKY